MSADETTRRQFLKSAAAASAVCWHAPYVWTANAEARSLPLSKNDRLRIGAIGMRYQGSVIAEKAQAHGDIVAIADCDRDIAQQAQQKFGGKAELYEDYRKMLERKDLDVITIGAPDHWHTAMVIDACRSGKDVYCEKPLTLTIDEGKLLCKVVKDTGRIVQVGSWQRSDQNFRLACELVRSGRIGALKNVTVVLGKNLTGGPFKTETPPPNLNWDLWQGSAPDLPYIRERSHYTFRWWFEYAGGQMTDWGAHHLDIAQWGIGMEMSGPIEIEAKGTFPGIPDGYNVPIDFEARMRYANGVELTVHDHGRNGVMFEGEGGRIFVNRGTVSGKPIEDLVENPLPNEQFKLYPFDNRTRPPRTGKLDSIINHMGNFFDCVRSRQQPLSDVESQHRTASLCHLANISMRLGRKLKWDPAAELFPEDEAANRWLKREQRRGYEIQA